MEVLHIEGKGPRLNTLERYYIVACCLKAGISESEWPSIARQRLFNQVSCVIVWVTTKHIHATPHRQTFPV
jgi:hypothetical protein